MMKNSRIQTKVDSIITGVLAVHERTSIERTRQRDRAYECVSETAYVLYDNGEHTDQSVLMMNLRVPVLRLVDGIVLSSFMD